MTITDSKKILDLVVVGAGPGGSAAASEALKGGLSVVQVEKFQFPRVKPCAGGLTPKAWALVPDGFERLLRGSSSSLEFNPWKTGFNRFHTRGSILRFVHRPEFDAALVERNLACERFQFFDNEAVVDISYQGCFQVQTRRRTLHSHQLVGADGANGLVNRIFKIGRPRVRATALEVVLPRKAVCFRGSELPSFDFGAVSKGYGWVFPKDHCWSAGLYTLNSPVRHARETMSAYLEQKGFSPDGGLLSSLRSHRYSVGGYRMRVPDFPLYLVGDAAGFAEAITGEGIYYALESGRLAGSIASRVCAGATSHRSYYRKLWGSVLMDTMVSFRLAEVFYRSPEKWLSRLRSPCLWRPLVQGYSEGKTLSRCALSSVSCLARSVGKVSLETQLPHSSHFFRPFIA